MFHLLLNLGAEETRTPNGMNKVESFTEASQNQTNSEKAFNAFKPVVCA